MAELPDEIRAFVAEKGDDGVDRGLRTIAAADLGDGDVVVRVDCSSVNYKDALATIPKGQVARISPLVPGIDLAGTVVEGPGEGTEVLVHGYDLGVAHHGGYAEYARVPGDWVVPRPEHHGLEPGDGPVLVTGATGGVGSTAVSILAARGYEVVASSGKDAREYLESLGAAEVIGREDVAGDGKPLAKQRWAAAVDSVGGAVLAGLFPQIRYGGAVAASGLTAGVKVETTVMPFILRSVSLIGVDSVMAPMDERAELWSRLADDLRPPQLDDEIAREITLDELEPVLDSILKGGVTGRTVVRVA